MPNGYYFPVGDYPAIFHDVCSAGDELSITFDINSSSTKELLLFVFKKSWKRFPINAKVDRLHRPLVHPNDLVQAVVFVESQ